jgi:hypothetical protein
MLKPVHEAVSVIASYDATTGLTNPRRMRWRGRVYAITRVSSRYEQRSGRRLYHFFQGYAGRLQLTLKHDSESLGWTLEEMDDGWGSTPSPTPPGDLEPAHYC